MSHLSEGFLHFLYLVVLLLGQEHHVIQFTLNLSDSAVTPLGLHFLLQLNHLQVQLRIFTHYPLVLLFQGLGIASYLRFEFLIDLLEFIESLGSLEHVIQKFFRECRTLYS